MKTKWMMSGLAVLSLALSSLAADDAKCPVSGKGTDDATDTSSSITGTVVATTNASRYTYVQIDTGKGKVWAAGPMTPVKVGDGVSIAAGNPNKNFHSPTLKRTFDELYFVNAIRPLNGAGACPVDAGKGTAGTGAKDVCPVSGKKADEPAAKDACPVSGKKADEPVIKPVGAHGGGRVKVAGGKTVAEVLAAGKDLSGKRVMVSGRVDKFMTGIMGRNWLHLRDEGTGADADHLTVTTKDEAKVGQVVTAEGVIHTDRDFGSGYFYEVIMEDAAVAVPK